MVFGFSIVCRTDIVLMASKTRPPALRTIVTPLMVELTPKNPIRVQACVRAAQDDDTGSALTNGLSHSQEIWWRLIPLGEGTLVSSARFPRKSCTKCDWGT